MNIFNEEDASMLDSLADYRFQDTSPLAAKDIKELASRIRAFNLLAYKKEDIDISAIVKGVDEACNRYSQAIYRRNPMIADELNSRLPNEIMNRIYQRVLA